MNACADGVLSRRSNRKPRTIALNCVLLIAGFGTTSRAGIARNRGSGAREGVTASQHFVSDARERIDVVARIRLVVLDHLGTGVRQRQCTDRLPVLAARLRVDSGFLRPRKEARDAEVDDLHLARLRDDHVARLEVTVNDARAMREVERLRDRIDDPVALLALQELQPSPA